MQHHNRRPAVTLNSPRPEGRTPSGSRRSVDWVRTVGYLVLGAAVGAAALVVGLLTMLVGLVPIALIAALVWRDAGAHRLTFVGGAMIGIGLCAWPTLGPAVTNNDPAVHYSDSTVPFLIAALVIGAIGVLLVIVSSTRTRTRPAQRTR